MKNLLKLFAGLVLAASVFMFINLKNSENDFFSANVEALTENESSGGICYYLYRYCPGAMLVACDNCQIVNDAKPVDYSLVGHCL